MFGDPDNPRVLDGPITQQLAFEAGCVVADGCRRLLDEQLQLLRGIRSFQKSAIVSQGYVMIPASQLYALNKLVTNLYPPGAPDAPAPVNLTTGRR